MSQRSNHYFSKNGKAAKVVLSGLIGLVPALIGAVYALLIIVEVVGNALFRSKGIPNSTPAESIVFLIWPATGIIGTIGYAGSWNRYRKGITHGSRLIVALLVLGILAAAPWLFMAGSGISALEISIWMIAISTPILVALAFLTRELKILMTKNS